MESLHFQEIANREIRESSFTSGDRRRRKEQCIYYVGNNLNWFTDVRLVCSGKRLANRYAASSMVASQSNKFVCASRDPARRKRAAMLCNHIDRKSTRLNSSHLGI